MGLVKKARLILLEHSGGDSSVWKGIKDGDSCFKCKYLDGDMCTKIKYKKIFDFYGNPVTISRVCASIRGRDDGYKYYPIYISEGCLRNVDS